jgi:hypothetical protein
MSLNSGHFFSHGVRVNPFGTAATVWPDVPAPDDRWWWLCSNRWNVNWQGKSKYPEKTCLSAILFSTNPTLHDPGSNASRLSGKPATNRLSYDTAMWWIRNGIFYIVRIHCRGFLDNVKINRNCCGTRRLIRLSCILSWTNTIQFTSILTTMSWIWESHCTDYEAYGLRITESYNPQYRILNGVRRFLK